MACSKQNLSDLVQVVRGEADFSTKLISRVHREPGSLLTRIEGSAPTAQRAYTSVQAGVDADIELNSDLVFCNHSCAPSVEFDMTSFEVRVARDRALKPGEDVTFFYPSTEWDMQQPFQCNCGSGSCLGVIRGAKFLDAPTLERYWLNPHVELLLEQRKKEGDGNGASASGSASEMADSVVGDRQ